MKSCSSISSRRLPLFWRLLAFFVFAGALQAQIVTETFRYGTTSTSWTLGNASGTYSPTLTGDSSGDGWLRLTSSGTNQATYAVYNGSFVAANTSVYASFNYTSWGGTGADGITFFLFDGSSSFSVGSYGGSLGYAQRTSGSSGTGPGMNGGYLAIGIDEFGNFSNATEGRSGGIGQTPDSISVRGPGQGYNGYAYLGGTSTLTQGIDSSSTTRPADDLYFRRVTISISPTNQLSVFLQTSQSGPATQILSLDLSGYARPETLRFGFASSTGDLTNVHEIRDLNISTMRANLWDAGNASNPSLWSSNTNDNWQLEYLPTTHGDVLFDNTFVTSSQSISLNSETKSLRSVSIDAPFSYSLTSGTVDINSGGAIGSSGIFVTGTKGSADHSISANVNLSNAATISNDSSGLFTISGGVNTGGNALAVSGSGNTLYSGVISGDGNITKSGTGNITFSGNNTYSGGTTITAGTLTAGHNSALGTGAVALQGGTLAGTSPSINVGNTISLQGNAGLSNVTTSGALNQTGGSYTLNMNNATQSGNVSLSNSSTNQTLTVQVDTGTSTISGVIGNGSSSASNLTKTGLGTLALSGTNTYTGTTTINEGAIQLNASNVLSSSSSLNIAGGTLNLNGNSQAVNQLTYSNNGTVDFGTQSGSNSLLFNSISTTPSGVLTINNFETGTDYFGSKATISQSILDTIYFSGIGSGAAQGTTTTTIAGYGDGWLTINPTGATANWYTWDSGGTDNDWTTKKNWVGDGVPPSNAKVAFGTGSRTSVNLDADKTVNAIRFNGADDSGGNAASFNIGGTYYTLTMGGTRSNSSAIAFIQQKSTNDQTISVGELALATNTVVDMIGSGNLTISAPITGSKNLVKEGDGGTLILSGNSGTGYTGKIYINAGTLQITNSGALGSTSTAYNTTIANGATLALSNNISTAERITLEGAGVGGNGAIRSLSGTNTLSGALTLGSDTRIQSDSGTLTLSGAIGPSSFTNTFTLGGAGNITVNNVIGLGTGSVVIDGTSASAITTFSGSSANTYTGLTNVKGGTLVLDKTSAGINAVAGNITIGDGVGAAASAVVKLNENNQIVDSSQITINSDGKFDLNGKSETIAKLTATNSGASISLGTSGSLTISSTQSSEFAGSITGSGSLIKDGSGNLLLSGSSSFSGTTTVQSGILALSHSNALGTSSVAVQSGGNIEVANNITVANSFNLSSQGTYANDGAIQSTAGNNTISGTVSLSGDSRIRADEGSTLNFSNAVAAGTRTLTMAGGGTTNYNSGVSGTTGGITKIDTGTAYMKGSSSFTGVMAVNGGLLVLDGTAATNTVNISGGTLKLGASDRLSNSATVTVNSGYFDVNGKSETISTLNVASAGTVALGSGTLITASGGTVSGLITGSGTLQTTSGANLTIASPQNFSGSIVVGSGSTLNLAATASGSTFGNLILNGGTIYLGTGGTAGTQYSYNFNNIIVNQPSTIDFGNGVSVTLSTNNLNLNNISTGGLTINNWVNLSDYFLAANWQGGVIGGTGTIPYNQIVFNGYNPNNTSWRPWGPGWGQITPVPEPSTYGALFMGLCTAFIAFRRFFGKKQN